MSRRKITNKSKIKNRPNLSKFSKDMAHIIDSATLGRYKISVVIEPWEDEPEATFQGRDKPPRAIMDSVKFWIDNCRESTSLQDYLNMMFNAQDFID